MSATVSPDAARQKNGSRASEEPTSVAEANPLDALANRLMAELAVSWQQGHYRPAEHFLAAHPELNNHPPAALRVIYEEVCQRQDQSVPAELGEMAARFPHWAAELRVLFDCHRLFEPPPAGPVFPQAEEAWGDFRLLAELGRGAKGRVFLATQSGLADRPVVLKLTECTGGEHLSLARLQHTGIVPLYFMQDDPPRNVRTLCMPYFGGVTLARLLEAMRDTPLEQRTGEQVLHILDLAQAAAPVELPGRGPARQFLAKATYPQAVNWMGGCLADALHYAHERGLIHLDIKPSNVLLANDGQPMLLDFHVAQPPILPNQPAPEWIGGTLAFMPREQQAAMAAVNAGQPIATIVDRRADIYALGVLFYEALGGSIPYLPGVSPPLYQLNPQVTRGLSDIVGKCLAYQAGNRYQDAAALAADLRRHLTDQRLRGVANRSWRERWDKWRRRKPHALSLVAVGAMALALSLGGAFFAWDQWSRQNADHQKSVQQAKMALEQGQEMLKSQHYLRARDMFRSGLDQVKDDAEARELAASLAEHLRRAQSHVVVRELHRQLERIRHRYGAEGLPDGEKRRLEAECRTVWDARQQLVAGFDKWLPAADQQQVRDDLLDLAVILADLHVQLAVGPGLGQAGRESLEILEETQKRYGPSVVLDQARGAVALTLGDHDLAAQARRAAAKQTPRTSWEFCLFGRSLLRSHELAQAGAMLEKAVDLDPQVFWPHFYQGWAAYEARDYAEAVSAFEAAIALQPAAECYYNRALAYVQFGKTERALHDFGQALTRGFDPATVHFRMAVVHEHRHERKAALECLRKALKVDPEHRPAREMVERLGK